ncbi:sensor histidine kinase [Paraburkholderia phenoliruptrix]|uniref:histidine kinase n=2 Tax=Paraburkholderia phenoliruptrix TaxID=252970 RepID=K0DNI8_9BURK|nr:sensor histidine kinase [Paraburkholderia phenoliruptrix]AFT85438.1 histidine kinase [Paraburkholderia phenoliruptrix BR3459a]MDR6421534.1 signal transduction histidine kinase [Paraburkholderia phenoliruptrix]CAB4047952.1 Adaptive-response sensory-kinase SasA [Paraburkholderia phenoliruptrix]
MRLTTKGLLLIAIPAIFELALLSGLVKAQSDAAEAERWAVHGQEVLRQTTSILDPVLGESVALRGAVLADDNRFVTPLSVWVDVDRRIDQLAELVSDSPPQVERVVQVRQAVQAYRQWSDRIQDLLRSGRRNDIVTRFGELGQTDVLDRFRQQVAAFQAEERRLEGERVNAADAARERQQMLVVAAVVGSLLFVALAVWLFTRGLRGRLALLSDNAGRLAGNEPLAPIGPGHDEIARLDLTLHETSRRLLESERIQARFQADLARRADELSRINETLRQQTQENEMFIYSVSHDLRVPLVNLQGFSKELIRACEELRAAVGDSSIDAETRQRIERVVNEDIGEALHYLQTAVLRASHIIDALLRLSRIGRVEYRHQKVEVRDIVPRVVDAMQGSIRARRAQVEIGELPAVWGDPTALEQVFANLIGNAVNYLDPSREGRIEIGTTPAPPGVQTLRIFYVRDNGLGIPAIALPRLFNAFQRLHGTAVAGEGIGLALVRRVVERHGGRVWAESAEGVGTTFYLSLPEAGARVAAAGGAREARGASASAAGGAGAADAAPVAANDHAMNKRPNLRMGP